MEFLASTVVQDFVPNTEKFSALTSTVHLRISLSFPEHLYCCDGTTGGGT